MRYSNHPHYFVYSLSADFQIALSHFVQSNLITVQELGDLKSKFDGFQWTANYMNKHYFTRNHGINCNWEAEFQTVTLKVHLMADRPEIRKKFYYSLTEFNDGSK